MLKYSKACKMVAEGFDLDELKYGSRKYDRQDKVTLQKVLMVENRIFSMYLKTGKCSAAAFPYDELKGNMAMSTETMQKLAKRILSNGWSPATHVTSTRKHFAQVPDYQRL